MAHIKMEPGARKAMLLDAGVEIASAGGIGAVTRASVARKVGVTDALINRYFAGREGLRKAVAEAGKSRKIRAIVASAKAEGYA